MFNLAIKVSVISFLAAMSSKILTDYCEEFAKIATDESSGGIIGNMPVLIQMVVVSFLLYLLIKKIPELVQGLLSGSPSLSSASMTQTAKNVTSTAVATGAAVASGGASVAGNMAKAAASSYGAGGAAGGGGIAGLARAGASAMNTGAGMMMSAAGGGLSDTMGKSTVGRSVNAGRAAAQRYFGVAEGQQTPTVTGLAVSGGKSVIGGALNASGSIASGVRGATSVAKDVARDISKYSPIK